MTGTKPASSAIELRDAVIQECKDPQRFIAAPMIFRETAHPVLDTATLRRELKAGQAGAIGEIMGQYVGLTPDDPVLEPYWALAEELDAPVMIHMGTSFPGTAYSGYPAFRLRLGNPMLLEDVLVKHPKLRVWVAHGGQPWTPEMFALMRQYPQLYIDVATSDWLGGAAGRPAFHAFLKEAIRSRIPEADHVRL